MSKIIYCHTGEVVHCRWQQVLKLYKYLKKNKKRILPNINKMYAYATISTNAIIALATITRKRRSDWQDVISLLH